MTRSACFRFLLGLLCVSSLIRPEAQAATQTVNCHSYHFGQGDIITTKAPSSQNGRNSRLYCGLTVDWFLAVQPNKLWHLRCSTGAAKPTEATVEILDMTNERVRAETFESYQTLCDVSKTAATTGYNHNFIATKLTGINVPYDRESCNAQHYTQYLAFGHCSKPSTVKNTCPVFARFNSRMSINGSNFLLADKNIQYEWPNGGTKGKLVAKPVRPKRQQSNSSSTSRGTASTGKSQTPGWNMQWFYRSKKDSTNSVSKRGGGGGGGHGGGSFSGGHGGEPGGDASPITGGGGSGRQIPGNYGPGFYGPHGHGNTSAAPKNKPFWSNIFWGSRNG